jgi:hypothetical protein
VSLADKEEITLAAWAVRWLQQLTGHSESSLYGVISGQTTLSIIGDKHAHARLRSNWVYFVIV